MTQDKYTAVWVSHTSIKDFLACPRAYFLKHVYRNPDTGHKVKIMSPPLALGQSVHEVLESLSRLPREERFKESLIIKFHEVWGKVSGKKGGFIGDISEETYKKRGEDILTRVVKNPGPLVNLAVKIKMDLPYFWLSEEANIILCGKIDWLEYMPETDSVHIIDFKTSVTDEKPDSLQLPIYCILATHCQKKPVSKISYWYLDRKNIPEEQRLPDIEEAKSKILDIAKQVKTARQLKIFKCPHKNGCYVCRPMEAVIQGEAEFVGINDFNEDVYILDKSKAKEEESVIF